jgi:hypothetical protein
MRIAKGKGEYYAGIPIEAVGIPVNGGQGSGSEARVGGPASFYFQMPACSAISLRINPIKTQAPGWMIFHAFSQVLASALGSAIA